MRQIQLFRRKEQYEDFVWSEVFKEELIKSARYKALQRALVKTIVDEMGLPLRPSDAFLLAHVTEKDARELTDAQREVLQPYSRGCRYRLCLTPYFVAQRDAEVMQ